jgi:hypothetical protein
MLHLLFPTKERFAKAFLAALTKAGVQVLSYDPDSYSVKTKDHGEFGLYNFHAEFSRLPIKKRLSYLPQFIDTQIVNRHELSKDWAVDRQFILPTIKHKIAFDQIYLRAELDSGTPTKIGPTAIPIGSRLYQMLCFDFPNAVISPIQYDPQQEHQVTPKQASDAAIANLWKRSKQDWHQPIPGTFLSPWQDNQDPARLALPGLIRQLKVKGSHVALTVHRDLLMITGSDDPTGLQAIINVANEQLEIPRAGRCPMLTLTPQDTWIDFQPPHAHPARTLVNNWNDIARATDYLEIHDLVIRAVKHRGQDTPVIPIQIMHEKEANQDFVVATWDAANPGLLPQSPTIAFVQNGRLIGFAPWHLVLAHAGPLLQKVDIQPDYWRITGFPDPATLAQMQITTDIEPWDLPRT